MKFAVIKSRNFDRIGDRNELSNMTKETPIEEKLDKLTTAMKKILNEVNFWIFELGLPESNTYLNSISGPKLLTSTGQV